MTDTVNVFHAALDETSTGEIILLGVIDPESLSHLKVAEYQREVLNSKTVNALARAMESGTVPDIELGMRGSDFEVAGSNVTLGDDVYIIDGLQRVTAAIQLMERGDHTPHIGGVIHFDTTEEWERERFRILNMERTRLSPNVLLRNMRHDYAVMESLHNLSSDKSFVLCNRITWEQRMKKGELMRATTFVRVIGTMHMHLEASAASGDIRVLVPALQTLQGTVGRNKFRDNVRTFFDALDQAFGVRVITYKEGATHMHGSFLLALAKVFAYHEDFWRGDRLFVERPLIRKIGSFPVSDTYVAQLANAAGKSSDILFTLLVEHINKGKRTKRLTPRVAYAPPPIDAFGSPSDEDEDDDEEGVA